MTSTLLAEFWRLADRARAPDATPGEYKLAAFAEAAVMERADGWERLALERDRINRLRVLVAPELRGRAAQRAVTAALTQYRALQWLEDQRSGVCSSGDPVRAICFAIMKLSRGKVSPRKLQKIFATAHTTPKIVRSKSP